MKTKNEILEKSFEFSLRILKLFKYLKQRGVDFSLCRQLLRCGTSIGANVHEAMGGSSRSDFIYKMQIAYKEAKETEYWIKLFISAEYIDERFASTISNDIIEILKLLSSILNTLKNKKNPPHTITQPIINS